MAVKSHSTSTTEATPDVPTLRLDSRTLLDDMEELRNTKQVQQRQSFFDEAGCSVDSNR